MLPPDVLSDHFTLLIFMGSVMLVIHFEIKD